MTATAVDDPTDELDPAAAPDEAEAPDGAAAGLLGALRGAPRRALLDVAFVLSAPALFYFALRPDWFYVQNGADPFMYVGYSQNMGDLLHMFGAQNYFASRWGLYGISRIFNIALGDHGGYFVLRYLMTLVLIAPLFEFARRRWGRAAAWASVVLVLCNPIVVRALLGEYSDLIFVPFLTTATVLLFWEQHRWRWARSAVAGVLFGLSFAAHVSTTPYIAMILVAWGGWRLVTARRYLLREVAVCGVASVATILAGVVIFRVGYGIDNIYQPSYDFLISSRQRKFIDPLRSLTHSWMGYQLWIYLPALLLGAWAATKLVRRERPKAFDLTAMALLAAFYLFQIWFQFGQNGNTLEIHYYWVYISPALIVGTMVVVGTFADINPRAPWILVPLLPAIILGKELLADDLRYSSWVPALVVAGVTLVVTAVLSHRRLAPAASLSALMVLGLSSTIFAPHLPPPDQPRTDADYDTLYGSDSQTRGEWVFSAETKLIDAIDSVDGAEDVLHLWYADEVSSLAGSFLFDTTGYLFHANVPPPPGSPAGVDELSLTEANVAHLRSGDVRFLLLIGRPATVDRMLTEIQAAQPPGFEVVQDRRIGGFYDGRFAIVDVRNGAG